jgi:hypothetical protein
MSKEVLTPEKFFEIATRELLVRAELKAVPGRSAGDCWGLETHILVYSAHRRGALGNWRFGEIGYFCQEPGSYDYRSLQMIFLENGGCNDPAKTIESWRSDLLHTRFWLNTKPHAVFHSFDGQNPRQVQLAAPWFLRHLGQMLERVAQASKSRPDWDWFLRQVFYRLQALVFQASREFNQFVVDVPRNGEMMKAPGFQTR